MIHYIVFYIAVFRMPFRTKLARTAATLIAITPLHFGAKRNITSTLDLIIAIACVFAATIATWTLWIYWT